MIETLLLDLDGTLVDSAADLAAAVNALRIELGLAALPVPQVLSYVGDGAKQLVQRAVPEDKAASKHLPRFLEIYRLHLIDQTRPYPGIEVFLESHRHHKVAVVTNKPYQLSIELLEGLNMSRYFDLIVGAETCSRKKPHPEPVLWALEQLGADPGSAVMIGDHHTDLLAGRAAGVRTCFCSYGIGRHDNVPHDFTADHPEDLLHHFPGVPM